MSYICKHCGESFDIAFHLTKHRKEKHPDKLRRSTSKPPSALDAILDAKNTIKGAISSLEQEREVLHKRVLEYDDIIAKYRKLL